MIARAGSGWQTILADLSLILFMVMAAAVDEAPIRPVAAAPVAPPALGEPVALWRGGDAAGLVRWLAAQPADPRQRLTIVAPLGSAPIALDMARRAGRPARVLIEPDGPDAPYAALTYDQNAELARALQRPAKALSTGVAP